MARNLKSNRRGHNSGGMIDGEALNRYVTRVETIDEDIDYLKEDRRQVYEEAKSAGFVTAKIRQMVKERKMDTEERADAYAVEAAYRNALGMLADLPLGEAAVERASRPGRAAGQPRKKAADEALAKARTHLDGPSGTPNITAEREHASADPYAAGREAALHGLNESRNPFDPGSLIGDEWLDGFKAAQSEQSGHAPGNA